MDGLEINFNRTAEVKRLAPAANGTSEYATVIAELPCHIQPLEEGLSEDIAGNFGKDYLMFCDVVDIQEGDRVVEGGREYHVNAVDSYTFLGRDRHCEVKLRVSNL